MNAPCPLTVAPGIPLECDKDHFSPDGAKLAVRRMLTAETRKAIFDRLAMPR
jgi:hypothetical protein